MSRPQSPKNQRMKVSDEKQWYAVLTGSRKEKFVAERLARKGIECYLPLVNRTKRYASRVKTHTVPLISCYVFVQIDKVEKIQVLETTYVYRFVEFDARVAVIPQREMDLLKQVVGEFDAVELVTGQRYKSGQQVELIAGELTGIKGTVIEERGSKRYLVELESLDLQLTWTVKKSHLRKVT